MHHPRESWVPQHLDPFLSFQVFLRQLGGWNWGVHSKILLAKARLNHFLLVWSMDNHSVHSPLLSPRNDENSYAKKKSLFVSALKWSLKTAIWVIFIAWAALIFLFPSQSVSDSFRKWIQATSGTPFGISGYFFLLYSQFCFCCLSLKLKYMYTAGSIFLLLSGPILIIAFLAIAHLLLSAEDELHEYVICRNFVIYALNFSLRG